MNTNNNQLRTVLFAVTVLVFLTSVLAHADNTPLIITPGTGDLFYGTDPSVTLGNLFQVGAEPITITSLGFFDAGTPGLNQSHSVGLWTTSGTLLARVDFSPGLNGFEKNGFIYQNLPNQVVLQPGVSYVLGAYYPTGSTDGLYVNDTIQYETWASSVTFNGLGRYTPIGAGFIFPNLTVSGLSYVGPNALYAVPEPAKYSGGTGEPTDPYQIASAADLLALAANTADYGECFILTADINMGGQVFTTAIIAADYEPAFTGTFDGNGHKITHSTITGGNNSCLGLFGYIGSGGSVKNLGIENCSVSGFNYIGGLVGVNEGSISDCYSTGSVSGVYGSYGGVSGSYSVGGLVGSNDQGSISNCYSTGSTSAVNILWGTIGGLVGWNNGSVSGSFWDTQTSEQMTSDGGTGKTTAEMKMLSTFTSAGWDFVEIWGVGENQTYPYLRTEPAGDLNHDKKVDFEDFAILASHWLEGI